MLLIGCELPPNAESFVNYANFGWFTVVGKYFLWNTIPFILAYIVYWFKCVSTIRLHSQ